jgi:Predicted dehydrogenases and related proteins
MHSLALIGCGRISFKHIEAAINNKEKIKLVACCDPKLGRAEARADEYKKAIPNNQVAIYADYREMLSREKPDICAIATESGYHPEMSMTCSKSGAHVICEKPMALSTADADKMIQAAREAKKLLTVCFQNRFNAPIQKARQALEAGRFGRVLHGAVQVRWNRNESYYAEAPWRGSWALDGGTLMNQCTHGIDLLQWMMGEDAVRVQAVTRRYLRPIEAEDFGAAIVEFASGAVGIIEGSVDIYPANLEETLSIFGEKGTAVIGGLAVNKIKSWRFFDSQTIGDTEEKVLDPNAKDPPTVYGFGHTALYVDFLSAIEENKSPLISGEVGKKALEIILAIYKSQKTGFPVDIPCDFSTEEMTSDDLLLKR